MSETGFNWYVINTYAGSEDKVAEAIKVRAARFGLSENFGEIVVPKDTIYQVRRGKRVKAPVKLLHNYILIQMHMNNSTWEVVKGTPKVTGFLGPDGKPTPVPQNEVDVILKQMEEGVTSRDLGIGFEVGETVKVTDGPFETFTGIIDEIDTERRKVKLSVAIFGRATSVELDYEQVQKLSDS